MPVRFRLKEKDLPPVKSMLLYAFRDQRLDQADEPFPGQQRFSKLKGAVFKVSDHQCLTYTLDDDRIQLTDVEYGRAPRAPDGEPPGFGRSYARGNVRWLQWNDYLVLDLRVGSGEGSYLLKRDGDSWVPVRLLGLGHINLVEGTWPPPPQEEPADDEAATGGRQAP